jgi:nitrogen-specific signal transduction histidine kinase
MSSRVEALVARLEAAWPEDPERETPEGWHAWLTRRQPLVDALCTCDLHRAIAVDPSLRERLEAILKRDQLLRLSLEEAKEHIGAQIGELGAGRTAARVYRNAGARQPGAIIETA